MGGRSSKNSNGITDTDTLQASIAITNPNISNTNIDKTYSYIVEKNKKYHNEMEAQFTILITLSIVILIILLFFISYKVFIFMTVNNIDIGIFPYSNGTDSNVYEINYLSEQLYYKSLSDTDKDLYLSSQEFEKDNAIKKYLVSQILV